MARPTKNGLDYFPFDVGFFGDSKVRILKSRYGADGIAVYVKILCDVYKEGYFLPIVNMGDYVYVLADEVGTTIDKAEQILTFLRNRAMVHVFDNKNELTGYDLDAVLTSRGIQKRYAEALKSRKKGIDEIKRDFWILTEEDEEEISAFYKSTKNDSYSEKNPSYSEKNPSYSEKNPIKESKVNKSKENIYHQPPYIPLQGGEGEEPNGQAVFFAKFPNVLIDNYSTELQEITDEDWKEITRQFEQSDWLRENCKTLSMLCRISKRIIAGEFAPFRKGKDEEAREEAREEAERRRRAEEFDRRFGADSQ